jgi:Raf kinase inhibitor-like YbhB/YbcL family protein
MRELILGMALAAIAAPAFADGFAVSTPAFQKDGTVAIDQVCDRYKGANHSPAVSWSGEPADTKSFAITMYDPDAPTGSGWWHWTVFNIPTNVHSLPVGAGDIDSKALPTGSGQGRNDGGSVHYSGPCPPVADPAHHYQLTVYAVKVEKLPLDAESSGAKVGFNLHFNTLAKAQVIGLFGAPKTP